MSYQFLTFLFLASLAQEQNKRAPMPVQPDGVQVVNVLVGERIGQKREVRQLTLSMPAPPDEDDERPAAPRNIPFNILTSVVEPENFDRWLFAEDRTEVDRHRHLDELLRSKLNFAAKAHKLTDEQRAKLQVAGRGDIKRFFDQVEDRRRDFEKDRHNFRAGLAALKRLSPLALVYRDGPFGDGSLFAKTLVRINKDQRVVQTGGYR